MKLDHLVFGHARALMQPIDILGDHAFHLAPAHQGGDRQMAAVGLGFGHLHIDLELTPPSLAPRVFR